MLKCIYRIIILVYIFGGYITMNQKDNITATANAHGTKSLTPSSLFNLAAEVLANNERLMAALDNEVPGRAHAYEDLLCPWYNYLNDLMPQQMEWAFTCVKRIYTYDCTRGQLVEAMTVVADKIKQTANAWAIELCTKSIQEAFNAISSPADAVALAAEIDKMKNACLASFFK